MKRKGFKKILKYGIIILILLSLVGTVILVGAIVDQNMKYLLFKKKKNEIASVSNLPNLPPFITSDMMQALFETQEQGGIPVSSGVAQIIQESGFGTYGPNGNSGQGLSGLAFNYKNLFGIKHWSGDQYASGVKYFLTVEQTENGQSYQKKDAFSVYSSYGDCIRQRGVMLGREPYLSHVAPYKNNCDGNYTIAQANGFVAGIRAGGWATDISYVVSLISAMEKYNLYAYDNMTWESYQATLNTGESGETVVVGSGYFCNPCPVAYISSEFGGRPSPGGIGSTNHKGRDYAAPAGSPIYAGANGVVERAEYNSVRGYYLLVNHGNGLKTVYQHCSVLQVSVGQTVRKGQKIATVGSTGASTGPHLHFEVWKNGTPVDPRSYL